ncbi:MAG TPA: hypothetical protein IGS52_14605 [Oscillatoriaceae cyanobacterium M33_DOE_052]|uniref:Uncharacterized protein n=1 Tax=Planktothricoides sp. SpSt-374 TaxID=2282167 RepID=A0A7C3VRI2_9CYAN|nr:hypothetical protein [Oscillatoriaceae cyanobacterium M33_DOE_052]
MVFTPPFAAGFSFPTRLRVRSHHRQTLLSLIYGQSSLTSGALLARDVGIYGRRESRSERWETMLKGS